MRVLLAIPGHWLFNVSITLSIILYRELMLPLDRSSAFEQVMIRPIAKVGDKANTGDNK